MTFNKLREFNINIKSLSDGKHIFLFPFSEKLFLFYDNTNDLKNLKGNCKLIINKTENLMEMYFNIKGKLILNCDRSLKNFNYSVKKEEKIIVKFG